MTDETKYETLRQLLACPVDWGNETDTPDRASDILVYDWCYSLEIEGVDREAEYAQIFLADYENWPIPDIDNQIKNAQLRRPEALKMYGKRAHRFAELSFMTPSCHDKGKHFRPKLNRSIINEETRNGAPSLFYCDQPEKELKFIFFHWVEVFFSYCRTYHDYKKIVNEDSGFHPGESRIWRRFMQVHQARICFDTLVYIGASEGRETRHVCFDIHFSQKVAHAFPISEQQAQAIMGDAPVRAVKWQGGF